IGNPKFHTSRYYNFTSSSGQCKVAKCGCSSACKTLSLHDSTMRNHARKLLLLPSVPFAHLFFGSNTRSCDNRSIAKGFACGYNVLNCFGFLSANSRTYLRTLSKRICCMNSSLGLPLLVGEKKK